MLNFRGAKFIKSATSKLDRPEKKLKEILFVGRSNVGKSSLINALVDNKSLCFTSSKPGHTRLLNYFEIKDTCYLVDAPGYGYSKAGHQHDENFAKMMEDYLSQKGFKNMKRTYFTKNNGIETINYAYEQNGVIMYPDLIKVKVALDNGEVLGIETTGYLNSHSERSLPEIKVSKDQAIAKINKKLEVLAVDLAVIPTEFKTELMCWEIKGKIDDREFLVYINVETGKEEDILVILNSSEGTLTM